MDLHGDAGLVVQWRMKAEFTELDDGVARPGDVVRRPDAQTPPVGPDAPFASQAVAESEAETVQLDVRAKARRKRRNDLGAQERLRPVSQRGKDNE